MVLYENFQTDGRLRDYGRVIYAPIQGVHATGIFDAFSFRTTDCAAWSPTDTEIAITLNGPEQPDTFCGDRELYPGGATDPACMDQWMALSASFGHYGYERDTFVVDPIDPRVAYQVRERERDNEKQQSLLAGGSLQLATAALADANLVWSYHRSKRTLIMRILRGTEGSPHVTRGFVRQTDRKTVAGDLLSVLPLPGGLLTAGALARLLACLVQNVYVQPDVLTMVELPLAQTLKFLFSQYGLVNSTTVDMCAAKTTVSAKIYGVTGQ
eukprot:7936255-Pyramimonas_sp.AAC.1